MGFGELAALDWHHVYFDREQTPDKTQRGKNPRRASGRHRHAREGTAQDSRLKTRARKPLGRHAVAGARSAQGPADAHDRSTGPRVLRRARRLSQPQLMVSQGLAAGLQTRWPTGIPLSLAAPWVRLADGGLGPAWRVPAVRGSADETRRRQHDDAGIRQAAQGRRALDREETLRMLYAAYRGEELPVANPVLTRGPVPEDTDA